MKKPIEKESEELKIELRERENEELKVELKVKEDRIQALEQERHRSLGFHRQRFGK